MFLIRSRLITVIPYHKHDDEIHTIIIHFFLHVNMKITVFNKVQHGWVSYKCSGNILRHIVQHMYAVQMNADTPPKTLWNSL